MGQYDYNYFTEEEKLKQQRALATSLQQKQLGGGQMVSGWYVPEGKGAMLGNILQNALGAYMGYKTNQGTDANDQQSNDALAAARAKMTTPGASELDAANWLKDPSGFTYKNPASVGPQPESLAAGQVPAIGVPNPAGAGRGFVNEQPGDRATYAAGAGRGVVNEQPGDRAAYIAGHPQQFSSGGGGQFTGSGASGSWGPSTPSTPDIPAPAPLQALAQPAPVGQAALPMAAQAAAQGGQTQPAAVSDFNFDPTQLNAKVSALMQAKAAREAQARDEMYNSGGRGRALANALDVVDLQRLTKIDKPKDGFTLKPGETRFDANGRKVAELGAAPDKEAVKAQAQADAAISGAEQFQGEIRRLVESKIPEDAAGKAGTVGALINKASGGIFKTEGAGAQAELDGVRAKAKQFVIQQLQASGIPASQLANSNIEGEALIASFLNIDYTRMTPEQIRTKLLGIEPLLSKFVKDQRAKYTTKNASPEAPPPTINGVPTYQRGQTIRPQ